MRWKRKDEERREEGEIAAATRGSGRRAKDGGEGEGRGTKGEEGVG